MAGYYTLDIAELTKQRRNSDKQPRKHQKEAFIALTETLPLPIKCYKGTLLVLPTGGGKTFTGVNWICRNILSQGIKVLWLAQSSYLIDQAADTFINEIHNTNGRDKINLRVVSSSTSHSNSGSIALTDDVLITTTQMAISAYSSEQLDGIGNIARTPFRSFVDSCRDTELFVVIDEAHHTPAYGCRTLLLSMHEEIENLYILGLTATPMHMDKRINGWLKNIYDQWICYQVDKETLQAEKILAVPKYIEKHTGMEFEVDDKLFDRLVSEHKDLPDNIIENLAKNHSRNDLIISDYLNNQKEYGKTLIFADRWFQCEYIIEKLKEQGISANAVYNVVTGQDDVFSGGSGRRNNKENEQIMQDFRDGKYDVIVNVKMLTEGVDVPDVKTVMITRQTTSSILLTQMIGRALRGEKAGGGKGKSHANIVFFHDTWKRLLPWADFAGGGLETERPPIQGRNPMRLISIHLIKMAVEDIKFKGFEDADFLTFIPVGFYNCEYTVAIEDNNVQELVPFEENIVVYEFNKDKYDKMINDISDEDLSRYAHENIVENQLEEKAQTLAEEYFDLETDNFDEHLINNITKIVHHIAQNKKTPIFVDFRERDVYDMDRLADELLNMPPLDADILLNNKFNDMSLYWNFFYKTFDSFMDAYYKSQKRALIKRRGQPVLPEIKPNDEHTYELTEEIKEQVRTRDNFTCLCCSKCREKGKRIKLEIDHIRPVGMGGNNAISNLQTLCNHCNNLKSVNEVDYRVTKSPLHKPKNNLELFDMQSNDNIENIITRIVNVFYHCKAVCAVKYSQRSSGKFYYAWEIVLYSGNNPQWLEPHLEALLEYVRTHIGWSNVDKIYIKN